MLPVEVAMPPDNGHGHLANHQNRARSRGFILFMDGVVQRTLAGA